MSGTRCNGWLRSLAAVAVGAAAVVVFAWRSQAAQDERINRNVTAVAVIHAKLDGIVEKIDEVRDILKSAHDAPAPGASWQEDREGRRATQERTSSFPASD